MKKIKKVWYTFKRTDFFKTFKEELVAVPLLLIGFYFINVILMYLFPNGAFFDFFSQIETIIQKIVLLFISMWTAHLALRVSFPKVYKFLHDEVYEKFNDIPKDKRIEYTIKFILTFILAAALVFKGIGSEKPELRNELIQTLNSQLKVREIAPNRSQAIDIYLRTVNSTPPNPWCAAFVGSNLYWCGISNPKSAWSPDYAKPQDIIWTYTQPRNKPLAGDVVTYYYSNIGRVGHVGFYEKTDSDGYFITIEGNTNGAGSREGDGVYKKKRSQYQVHAISRYIY